MKKIILIVFILAFVFFLPVGRYTLYADDNAITVTTYYPAPSGAYKELDAQAYYDYGNRRYFLNPFPSSAGQLPYGGISLAVKGKVGIGTTDPQARLDINAAPGSPDGILLPRMTYAKKMAIPHPPEGLLVYQIDDYTQSGQPPIVHGFYYYTHTPVPGWKSIASVGGSGGNFWSPDGDNIYNDNTDINNNILNVGIGTSAPLTSARLRLGGSLNIEGVSEIPDSPNRNYLIISEAGPDSGYVRQKKAEKNVIAGVIGNGLVYAERIDYVSQPPGHFHRIINPRVIYTDSNNNYVDDYIAEPLDSLYYNTYPSYYLQGASETAVCLALGYTYGDDSTRFDNFNGAFWFSPRPGVAYPYRDVWVNTTTYGSNYSRRITEVGTAYEPP